MQAQLAGAGPLSSRRPGPVPSSRRHVTHRVLANPALSPASDEQPSTSGSGMEPRVSQYVRPPPVTRTPPSISSSGTLRPDAEWFPAWMQYRKREDNYVFWQDKFMRSSLEIPGERRAPGAAADDPQLRALGALRRRRARIAPAWSWEHCQLQQPTAPVAPLLLQRSRSAGRSSRRCGGS